MVDMVKALAQLHSLFGRNSAVYSGLNLRKRRFAAPVHELCDVERFTGMCEDVFGNGTSGFAKDISEHIIQFEVGHGEAILSTVLLAGQHIRQLAAVTNEVAQMANGWRRDKRWLDHVAHEQVANPLCILPVSFVALQIGAGIALVLVLAVLCAADQLVAIFNSEGSAALAAYAQPGIRLYFLGFPLAAVNIIQTGCLSATGQGKVSSLLSLSRGVVAIVVFAFLLSALWGITGVWLAFPASELFTLLLAQIMVRRSGKSG